MKIGQIEVDRFNEASIKFLAWTNKWLSQPHGRQVYIQWAQAYMDSFGLEYDLSFVIRSKK